MMIGSRIIILFAVLVDIKEKFTGLLVVEDADNVDLMATPLTESDTNAIYKP